MTVRSFFCRLCGSQCLQYRSYFRCPPGEIAVVNDRIPTLLIEKGTVDYIKRAAVVLASGIINILEKQEKCM